MYDFAEAQSRYARHLLLTLSPEADVAKLAAILTPHRAGGDCPLRFAYANAHARCALLSGEGWRVLLSDALLTELRALLGKAAVQVEM